jgi:hypothetical protein
MAVFLQDLRVLMNLAQEVYINNRPDAETDYFNPKDYDAGPLKAQDALYLIAYTFFYRLGYFLLYYAVMYYGINWLCEKVVGMSLRYVVLQLKNETVFNLLYGRAKEITKQRKAEEEEDMWAAGELMTIAEKEGKQEENSKAESGSGANSASGKNDSGKNDTETNKDNDSDNPAKGFGGVRTNWGSVGREPAGLPFVEALDKCRKVKW